MTGQSPKSTRGPYSPKVSMPRVTDQASKSLLAVEDSDLSNTAFGPNFDRGRYPAQRPRHGSSNKHASRPSISLAADSIAPVLSPPAVEENPYHPPTISMDVPTNADNVLPSPSPSVEARPNSVNAIEIQDEENQPQAAGPQPAKAPTATFEELVTSCGGIDQFEKLLKDAGKSNHGPSQIAASAVAQELPGAIPSSCLGPRRWPPGFQNQTRSESDHDAPAPSNASKRPQEVTDEPRKRLQSLPGSFSEDAFALPSAITMLPSLNSQSSVNTSPSGADMRTFAQDLAQRIQLVAKLQGREGSHVERPRLGLLGEACENSDHFYLVLHQLFCFDHQVRKSNGQVPGLNKMHRKGLEVVAFLLVANEKMVDDAVAWFSVFPLPWGDFLLNLPEFGSAHAKVLRCLEKMATYWVDMRSQCTKRRYPPLVDELVVLFNVESFLFQQIIFRAVLRDIWSGTLDTCFRFAEELFNRDYKAVMSRLSSGSTTEELAKLYQQAVIKEYQQLLGSHWQHTIAEHIASVAAPVQEPSQIRLAPANHYSNNRRKSQPEYNKKTQCPLTLNSHTAQRHSLSAASGSVPIAVQTDQLYTQSNLLSQSQALASNAFSSPQVGSFTQSPTTLQGFLGPVPSMNPNGQWTNPQQQRERRTSSIAGNLRNTQESMTSTQRTPHVVPSNALGNPHMYQFQLNIGSQQQSHNRIPSSSTSNSHPCRQSEVGRSLNQRASETALPASSQHPSLHPSPSLPTHEDHTPFVRSYSPLPNHPNPTTSALHQAHLRSPTLSYSDPSKNRCSMPKCYRFIKHVLMPPEELDRENRHVNWDFSVNKELTDGFARDAPSLHGAPPTRAIMPGSRLCRIRCINLKDKPGMPTQSEWAVADNVWPGSTAIVLNGIALDIRKKTHHGKDLPIDVTRYIRAGQNNLSTAVIGFQTESPTRYAIGVEFIQVVDEQKIKDEIRNLPWFEARERILGQSKNLDPDVEVLQSQKVLDLTDPFTARIFEVPVRGINCHHNQCFDRDTFLQTRSGRVPGEPCDPDQFRCPICSQDARPQSMVIDKFFEHVRMVLKERARLDAKAIILYDSGEWKIKEEEKVMGESGDGTGKRSAKLADASSAIVSVSRKSMPFRETIEIDD